jgi:hypothetical protein
MGLGIQTASSHRGARGQSHRRQRLNRTPRHRPRLRDQINCCRISRAAVTGLNLYFTFLEARHAQDQNIEPGYSLRGWGVRRCRSTTQFVEAPSCRCPRGGCKTPAAAVSNLLSLPRHLQGFAFFTPNLQVNSSEAGKIAPLGSMDVHA